MLDELWEVVVSRWGLLGLGALLVVAGPGRKYVRCAAKGVIKAGMSVSDSTREFLAELKEQGSDLVAEVQAERKEAAAEHEHQETAAKSPAAAEQ